MQGIGYQGYRNLRINEGIPPGSIEEKGNERYSVYWGRMHIVDHETGVLARGIMKFGRGKFTTAIQRGRNEGGADFRIYGEIIVDNDEATYVFERKISEMMSSRNVSGSQGQKELYTIKDNELEDIVRQMSTLMDIQTSYWIREVNIYHNDKPKILEFDRSPNKKEINADLLEGCLIFQ